MSEHMPTDWQLGSLTPGLLICRRDGLQIKIDAIDDDLACFILHAVKDYRKTMAMRNNHEQLIEIARLCMEARKSELAHNHCVPEWLLEICNKARAALAAAEGK